MQLENGTSLPAWASHHACLRDGPSNPLCDSTSYSDYIYEDDYTTRNAIELLRRRPKNQPFALWISWPGPHPPFTVTSNQTEAVNGRSFPGPVDYKGSGTGRAPAESCKSTGEPQTSSSDRCDYAAEMERLDVGMQAVFSEVRAQGVADDTVFLWATDHGEMVRQR